MTGLGCSVLLGAIAMDDFYFVSGFAQALVYVFGDHDGAMLSAGASETDGEVALAFANVVWQKVDQKFRDAVDELLCLRKRPDVFGDAGMASCERAELGNKMRVREKAHIEDKVGIVGQSVFVSKAHAGDENRLLRAGVLFEAVGQVRAQFVDIKF